MRRSALSDQRARGHLQQAQLGAHQAHERRPAAVAQPGQRRAQQHQAAHPLGLGQAGLDGHPPAHAVAHQRRPFHRQLVERGEHRAGEPGRVVGRADRLVGFAEAGQVHRHHAVAVGQRGHRGQERGLRAAQAVQAEQGVASACRRTGSKRVRSSVRSVSKANRPGSSEPLVAARKPTPRWRLPRICSRPVWKARMPPRTSSAMLRQVAASAVIAASGSVESRASTRRTPSRDRRASQSPSPSTRRRTSPRPPGTSISSGS